MPNHLRDFAPNMKKYKAVLNSPCRKIEIWRITKIHFHVEKELVVLSLKVKVL